MDMTDKQRRWFFANLEKIRAKKGRASKSKRVSDASLQEVREQYKKRKKDENEAREWDEYVERKRQHAGEDPTMNAWLDAIQETMGTAPGNVDPKVQRPEGMIANTDSPPVQTPPPAMTKEKEEKRAWDRYVAEGRQRNGANSSLSPIFDAIEETLGSGGKNLHPAPTASMRQEASQVPEIEPMRGVSPQSSTQPSPEQTQSKPETNLPVPAKDWNSMDEGTLRTIQKAWRDSLIRAEEKERTGVDPKQPEQFEKSIEEGFENFYTAPEYEEIRKKIAEKVEAGVPQVALNEAQRTFQKSVERRLSEAEQSGKPLSYFEIIRMMNEEGKRVRETRARYEGPGLNPLELLNRPTSAIATGLNEWLNEENQDGFSGGFKRGLYGHGLDSVGDAIHSRDRLYKALQNHPTVQKLYRMGRDFALDTATDPMVFGAAARKLVTKYGPKAYNIIRAALKTKAGKTALIGTGLTALQAGSPDDADAAVRLKELYDGAHFFRGLNHVEKGQLAADLERIQTVIDKALKGDKIAMEMVGSIIAPNAYTRAYPYGILFHVPEPSFLSRMSPRTMFSKMDRNSRDLGTTPSGHLLKETKLTYDPRDPDIIKKPQDVSLEDFFRRQADLFGVRTDQRLWRKGFYNEAHYRFPYRWKDLYNTKSPADLIAAVVASLRRTINEPLMEFARRHKKPVVDMSYIGWNRKILEGLGNPFAKGYTHFYDEHGNKFYVPATDWFWSKMHDPRLRVFAPGAD